MGSLLLTVMVLGFVLVALVIVMFVVSAFADWANTIRGPVATLEELEAQIRGKQTTLADLEAELEKRRAAIAGIADIQAETDSLIRQRDELLAEWQQLDERREEVLAMRVKTEDAQSALADARGDLAEKSGELEGVEARLKRAEELVGQIASLEDDHNRLEQEAEKLREELSGLQTLKAGERELREKIERLERETARAEGEIENFNQRRENDEEAARIAQAKLEELKANHTDEAARVASKQTKLAVMEQQRAELLTQIETYKKEAGIAGGPRGGDPLSVLQALPPILNTMRDWDEHADEHEDQALQRVREHMKEHGLEYHARVISAFHTAMKVNETAQMAVLAGISGTGKSQLPRRYAEAMGIGFLQVPVQPRWDSPQDLMGFYNYIQNRFRPTDLARALYHLDAYNGSQETYNLRDRMMLVLLDEMNLARIEYYFSDFLSRLENRPGLDETDRAEARKDAELELEIPMPDDRTAPRIFPGYNVLFAGTMNEDESTQSLSDKVVDRANLIRFAAPKTIKTVSAKDKAVKIRALSYKHWRTWVRGIDTLADERADVEEHVEKMVEHMSELGRPFGHRLGRAIMAYAANYPQVDGRRDIRAALADQVEMRLLPKLRGVDVENAGTALKELSDYVETKLDDTELAEAIRDSTQTAEEGSLPFTWRGVTRE